MNIEVTCPSGLAGEVRGWKTKEANVMADKVARRKGTAFDTMLSNCWLTTTEPGPYPATNGKPFDWKKSLLCDRFYTLLKIREATYGANYGFKIQCPDRDDCGKPIEWEVDLNELPFKPLPDESIEKIRGGLNEFETTIDQGEYEGRLITFKLQTAEDDKKTRRIIANASDRLVVASLASRIVRIDDVPRGGLAIFLDDLELPVLLSLLDAFDEVDGGVETKFDIQCPECAFMFEVDLPLGRDFFLPSTSRRRVERNVLDSL